MNPPDRKRKRWQQDLPAFLDAASSVSSTTFGARRLPELKALWSQVRQQQQQTSGQIHIDESLQSTGHKISSRHLRRRTTSHLPRRRHRFPQGQPDNGSLSNNSGTTGSTITCKKQSSRKSRRKRALLRNDHGSWQQNVGDVTTKLHWIPTHLWHAKRFHMRDMFGWRVPLLHTNRGSRAVHRLFRMGRTTLQDITWRMQPIVIFTRDLKFLIQYMTRLCPTFLPKSHWQAIVAGERFGTGVLHEPDSFPTKAIGPATWWIRQIVSDVIVSHEMYLFLHPSIRPRLEELLEDLHAVATSQVHLKTLDGGLACFQLQGTSSTRVISEALELQEQDMNAAVSVGHLAFVKIVMGVDTKHASTTNNDHPFDMKVGEIMLIRQDDNSQESSSWLLICSVSAAHDIFMSLSRHAISVPIGYVEETHMNQLFDPQSALFPAAYPDCEQGNKYWKGSLDWSAFRSACESGYGRVRFSTKPNQHESLALMSRLARLTSCAETIDEKQTTHSVVVVRGVYGAPFEDLLQQCAQLSPVTNRLSQPPDTGLKKRTRPHRSKKHEGSAVLRLACRISNTEAHARIEQVQSLASSLSLATTMIRCKVHVYGRGSLALGDSIYGCSSSDERMNHLETLDPSYELGLIVEGSFAADLGLVQGYGFVAASGLLNFLQHCLHPDMMAHEGTLLLIVTLRRATRTTIHRGILSLLL